MSRHVIIEVVSLEAKIGDFTFNDVIQYTANWGVNSIPMAALTVATGRRVDTHAPATIHEAASSLTSQLKAEVFLTARIRHRERANPGLPSEQRIKIFEGKLVGIGWQRTETGGQFQMHLLHWIGDLNYASAISASLHPGSVGNLAYPAVFASVGPENVTPGLTPAASWVPGPSRSSLGPEKLSDVWGSVLHPWMTQLAGDNPLDDATGGGIASNAAAVAALARMAPNPDGVPLEVDTTDIDGGLLVDGIREAIIGEYGSNWTNTTLWGKLVGDWAPAYWFSVVPRVEDALVVPVAAGLRGEPWAVLGDEDYGSANLNAQLQQVLRSVKISYPIQTATGFDPEGDPLEVAQGTFLGSYSPDPNAVGMTLVKDAPKWLSDPFVVGRSAELHAGLTGLPIGAAVDQVDAAAPAATTNPELALTQQKTVANRYAEQWYVIEALKGRVGEVVGKLRFDISPGSNVVVEAARDRSAVRPIAVNVYASVVQISYMINAETKQAATAFTLDHIRTAQENTAAGLSIEKPPLYTTAWRGAKLSPAAPDPEQLEA